MRKKVDQPKKARLTIELPVSVRQNIGALMIKTEATSITNVIKRSVNLYAEIVNTGSGCQVILRAPDGTERQVVFL